MTTVTTSEPATGSRTGVAALCLVQFVDVLGVTVVVTALPSMLADLHAPASAAGPVVTGYAMFFGGLLVLGARTGDRFGPRRVLLAGIGLFGAGSLLAGFAGSVVVLAAGRCLQGAAAAVCVPAALRLITGMTPEGPARRRAIALWSAAGAAAGASGFVLGGLVTQFGSWPLIFWITAALAVALGVVVRLKVPDRAGEPGQSLDVAGGLLLTALVMALVLGAAELEVAGRRVLGAGLVVAGLLAVPVLALLERRRSAPLLPAAALRHPGLRLGVLGSFLNTASTSSAATLATLRLQDAEHVSAAAAGALLLPFSVGVVAGSSLSGRAVARVGHQRTAAVGLTLIAAGDLGLAGTGGPAVALPFCVAVSGLGIGLSSVATTTLGTDVPPELQGVAAGLVNTAAQLGTALGIAVILLVATAFGHGAGVPAGARWGWALGALLAATGAAVMATRHRSAAIGHSGAR